MEEEKGGSVILCKPNSQAGLDDIINQRHKVSRKQNSTYWSPNGTWFAKLRHLPSKYENLI